MTTTALPSTSSDAAAEARTRPAPRRGPRRRRRAAALLAAGALLAGACSSSDDANDGASDGTIGSSVPADPATAGVPTEGWPTANGDPHSTRAVLDSPISSTNVDTLEVAWTYEMPGVAMMGNGATNPLIIGDTVYAGDLTTAVHAVDLATGEQRWSVESDASMFGPTGVAVGHGKVFAPHSPEADGAPATGIAAYDAATGEQLWTTNICEEGDQLNIAPVVTGELVIASSAGFPQGHRGIIHALDQATGDIVWTFDTTTDDLWGDPELNSGGGAWYPPAIDPEAGIAYVGTGNPYPFPGTAEFPNGSSRPGPNLYANSLVALDLGSGELLWYHQAVEHDIFDQDSMLANIVDLPDGGRVIVNSGKHGRILGLDPDSHELLYDVEVGMHENDRLTELTGPTRVLPGSLGGVETPMASADGIVYASVVNAPIEYQGPDQTSVGFDVELGSFDSQLVAVDASDGSIVWDVPIPGDSFGGATVVNDLVVTSNITGEVLFYDRSTGDEVFRTQLDGGINGWPAVVDDTIIVPVGLGQRAALVALRLPG